MPTYEYACKECGGHLEVVQKFTDDALTTCPSCSGPLRKVFGSIGISFKGSGFYKTDSRSGSGSKGASGGSSSDAGSSSPSDAGSSAPAATPAASPSSTGGSSSTPSAAAS